MTGFGEVPGQVMVVGFARTGRAVAARLRRIGSQVVAVDDRRVEGAAELAEQLGIRLLEGAPEAEVARLAGHADLVVASPGVPPKHPALVAAPEGRLVSEIELAYRLSEVPIVAVTGTNGKTTVTSLAAEMLAASGVAVLAAGNIGTPLVEVVPGPGRISGEGDPPGGEPAVIVAEVSSFQLALAETFRPIVGTWLNLAEDHLDWHRDLAEYAAAKERIWANQQPEDVSVANAGDPVVMAAAGRSRGRLVTFGEGGEYHEEGGVLLGPGGAAIVAVERLPRSLPHDRANVLAAAATAIAGGATVAGCAAAAEAFRVAPHRVELIADDGAVRWYDDSKATAPSAVCAALEGFESVVLIAGGRNKGLDLRTIRDHAAALPGLQVRAVVALGEAAGEVEAAFAGFTHVERAASMEAAIEIAGDLARDGDAVLLSPGCASFDWYSSYAERGADFAQRVLARLARRSPRTPTGAGI